MYIVLRFLFFCNWTVSIWFNCGGMIFYANFTFLWINNFFNNYTPYFTPCRYEYKDEGSKIKYVKERKTPSIEKEKNYNNWQRKVNFSITYLPPLLVKRTCIHFANKHLKNQILFCLFYSEKNNNTSKQYGNSLSDSAK